jgi:hypothetical protein
MTSPETGRLERHRKPLPAASGQSGRYATTVENHADKTRDIPMHKKMKRICSRGTQKNYLRQIPGRIDIGHKPSFAHAVDRTHKFML